MTNSANSARLLQKVCREACDQGGRKIAVLHLDFAHRLYVDPEIARTYSQPTHPAWAGRFGAGSTVQDTRLILFPFYDAQHYVRFRVNIVYSPADCLRCARVHVNLARDECSCLNLCRPYALAHP